MIVLFTDFGWADAYVGQLHAALARCATNVRVVDLFHSVPSFDIRAGAYLLPAYIDEFPTGTVFVCVVDPGVGGARRPVMARIDRRWFVGPDNGLLSVLARRARQVEAWEVLWQPPTLSASFHARDLFVPVAARIALKQAVKKRPVELTIPSWPADFPQVLYIDRYGNGVTGLRGHTLAKHRRLRVGKHLLGYARVFDDAPRGRPFWYVNANGLVEIALREDSAARRLGLRVGTTIRAVR